MGHWEVYFRGTQLKIASRKHTGINVYHHPIPAELNGLIDEWLTFWRPRRLPEKGSDLVFLNQEGRPLNSASLNRLFIEGRLSDHGHPDDDSHGSRQLGL